MPARKKCQQSGVLLAPLLEDSRVIHPNNVRELDRWSKLVVSHEDHTIAVTYRHYAHAYVNRPGAWTKKKTDNPQEWARQIRSYNRHQLHIHLLTYSIRFHTKTYIKPALMP